MLACSCGAQDRRWMVVGSGDFDGDGQADVFWRSYGSTVIGLGSGANLIWRSGRPPLGKR